MIAWYWSYLLTIVGVFGLYLAGRKIWWSWFVGAAAQLLWIAYALVTHQYGFVISALAYGWVYFNNGLVWSKQHRQGT